EFANSVAMMDQYAQQGLVAVDASRNMFIPTAASGVQLASTDLPAIVNPAIESAYDITTGQAKPPGYQPPDSTPERASAANPPSAAELIRADNKRPVQTQSPSSAKAPPAQNPFQRVIRTENGAEPKQSQEVRPIDFTKYDVRSVQAERTESPKPI